VLQNTLHQHLNLAVTSATAPTRGGPNTGRGCTHVIEVSMHDMYTLVHRSDPNIYIQIAK